jgi:hypothetical protein
VQIACGDRHRGTKNIYKTERQKIERQQSSFNTWSLAFLYFSERTERQTHIGREALNRKNTAERTAQTQRRISYENQHKSNP